MKEPHKCKVGASSERKRAAKTLPEPPPLLSDLAEGGSRHEGLVLFGLVVATLDVPNDISSQAITTEYVDDFQDGITFEGLAGQPFRNPSYVEVGVLYGRLRCAFGHMPLKVAHTPVEAATVEARRRVRLNERR